MITGSQPPGASRSTPVPQGKRGLNAPGRATVRCVTRLQALYRRDNPAAVATVARLRRAAGRTVHDTPDIWGTDGLEDLAAVREEMQEATDPAGGEAPPGSLSATERRRHEMRAHAEEEAVHLAVTLWALHQQSVRDDAMHEFGWSLGRAVRVLSRGRTGSADRPWEEGAQGARSGDRQDGELEETLRKRFVRIGTSSSFDMLAVRLRDLVLLLRGARIPLDYGRLADELCAWQNDNLRADVRRAWGRSLHLSYSARDRSRQDDGDDGTESADASVPIDAGPAPDDPPDPGY